MPQRLRRSVTARKVVRAWDYTHATRKNPCVAVCGAPMGTCQGWGGGRPWPRPRRFSPFAVRSCAARCGRLPEGRSAAALAVLLGSAVCSPFAAPPVRRPLKVTAATPQSPTMNGERLKPSKSKKVRKKFANINILLYLCRCFRPALLRLNSHISPAQVARSSVSPLKNINYGKSIKCVRFCKR